MPNYVYGCTQDKTHPRVEIIHGMLENPDTWCSECGAIMKRVPQPLLAIAFNTGEIIADWMDENYRRKRSKRQPFSPNRVKRPGKPIPMTGRRPAREQPKPLEE